MLSDIQRYVILIEENEIIEKQEVIYNALIVLLTKHLNKLPLIKISFKDKKVKESFIQKIPSLIALGFHESFDSVYIHVENINEFREWIADIDCEWNVTNVEKFVYDEDLICELIKIVLSNIPYEAIATSSVKKDIKILKDYYFWKNIPTYDILYKIENCIDLMVINKNKRIIIEDTLNEIFKTLKKGVK